MSLSRLFRYLIWSFLIHLSWANHVKRPKSEKEEHDLKSTLEDLRHPEKGHRPGGLPMISDSAFSLVILLYVSIAFVFVFFMFCWKNESRNARNGKKVERQCVLMAHSISTANLPHDDALHTPNVIPATPTRLSRLDDVEEDSTETSYSSDKETSLV